MLPFDQTWGQYYHSKLHKQVRGLQTTKCWMKVYYPCPLHKQVKGLQSAGRKFLAVIAALYLGSF